MYNLHHRAAIISLLVQVLFDAAAAKQAQFSDSPALLVDSLNLQRLICHVAAAEEQPCLQAARAAASALAATHRAIAAEALLASLALSLAEADPQVTP